MCTGRARHRPFFWSPSGRRMRFPGSRSKACASTYKQRELVATTCTTHEARPFCRTAVWQRHDIVGKKPGRASGAKARRAPARTTAAESLTLLDVEQTPADLPLSRKKEKPEMRPMLPMLQLPAGVIPFATDTCDQRELLRHLRRAPFLIRATWMPSSERAPDAELAGIAELSEQRLPRLLTARPEACRHPSTWDLCPCGDAGPSSSGMPCPPKHETKLEKFSWRSTCLGIAVAMVAVGVGWFQTTRSEMEFA